MILTFAVETNLTFVIHSTYGKITMNYGLITSVRFYQLFLLYFPLRGHEKVVSICLISEVQLTVK